MSGSIFTQHDKGEPSPEQVPLTSSYSPEKQHMEIENEKPLLKKENGNARAVVTHEPSSSPKWSPLSSGGRYQKITDSSLVLLESDDEDESLLASTHATSAQQVNKQLSFQLARDGYKLDQMPDDERIDLFPAKTFHRPQACTCCHAVSVSCVIS